MPSKEEHLAKEARSAAAVDALVAAGPFVEWAIVVTAYCALHLVEAWFATIGRHHLSHNARNDAVNRYLPSIASAYFSLQDASRVARYDRDGLLEAQQLESALADFRVIEAEVRALL
jgi:hypothetical protein